MSAPEIDWENLAKAGFTVWLVPFGPDPDPDDDWPGRPIAATRREWIEIARAVVAALGEQGLVVVRREDAARVKPPTQADWLVAFAKGHEGIVRVTDAKKALIAAGKTHAKTGNIYGHLTGLIERSDEYEKVGPGTYRWIPFAALAAPGPGGGEERDG